MSDKFKNWIFFKKKTFEYQQKFNDYYFPWVGHIHFGYDLICNIKPGILVELGTYKGTSFFSFLQAIKDTELNTKSFAVDTWRGDEHAGFYGDEFYNHVVSIIREFYQGLNTRLLKMFFDEALKEFENNSIDILHIDGLHTYEAVMHDFKTWFPKVKDDGYILFHDIRVVDFGVCRVWDIIKREYPDYTFIEFEHSFGLGVMSKNNFFASLFRSEEDKKEFVRKYEDLYKEVSFPKLKNANYELLAENESLKKSNNQIKAENKCNIKKIMMLENNYAVLENSNESLKRRFEEMLIHFQEFEKELTAKAIEVKMIRSRKIIKTINKILKPFSREI